MNMIIKPVYKTTLHMLKLIDEISSLRAGIINSPIKVTYKPMLQKEASIKNAMGSTAIEGFILSLPEVKALASNKLPERHLNTSERAVFNYLAALLHIHLKAGKKTITNRDVLTLHKITGEGAVEHGAAGEYRKIQNYVVGAAGNVIYRPPAASKIPGLMDELIEWINKDSTAHIPAIASGIIHYELVAIHPFVDGNGRVARLFGMWELLRRKFDTMHIFAIDDIIYEHKKNYYFALNTVKENDLTGWLEFYLETIAESLTRVRKRLDTLPVKTGKEELVLSPKQEKMLGLLRDAGQLSAKEISAALKVTVQGAHFLLRPLIKSGMVKRHGGRKTGKFLI